ncbi:sensor histidine kinase [Vallitalea okinawensis]|uniref:sensor histidine kinase n=1 Tax=Vallitalea okinawensis TaxID=2078660 RepID=UPI001479586F|nr:HAMP domain-containing sensor histidine kinase [Vallitalea okinawensis]
MTIKKLVLKSNTFIVLTSLVTLFVAGIITVGVFSQGLIRAIEDDNELDENVYTVQSLIRGIDEPNWSQIGKVLTTYDYELYVEKNGSFIYSALLYDEQDDKIKRISAMQGNSENAVYFFEPATIVRRRLTLNGEIYQVYAINTNKNKKITSFGIDRVQMFIIRYLMLGISGILGIYLISRFYTERLVRKIMEPIQALMLGVGRIENNNFLEKITYQGEEEFEQLCQAFNGMQAYLDEETKKNTAYDQARTDMISGISHDLRTPLTSIKGFLKGMKDGVANSEKKREQYVNICYKKACDMDNLLQKLFYYSKLETKRMPFYFEVVDLAVMLSQFVNSKRDDLNESATIHYEKPDRLMKCRVDVDQFFRVFSNLVENSVKYAGVERIKINVSLFEEMDYYRIEIADNGLGIESVKLEKIFDQFYRGDESRNSKNDGSGLGLYVSKQVIERHQGEIVAENHNGLKVIITIPKSREDDIDV